jgi:hypothetical protein
MTQVTPYMLRDLFGLSLSQLKDGWNRDGSIPIMIIKGLGVKK